MKIPFIEANDKDILYNNVRPIDYNQAVNEVGQFVADSCGHRANIFLVTRSRHRRKCFNQKSKRRQHIASLTIKIRVLSSVGVNSLCK